MTDEKKKLLDDMGDTDWDRALSEWDTGSFVPEVAKDVVTDKPAGLAGGKAPRPLYRAPAAAPAAPPPKDAPPPAAPRAAPPKSATPRRSFAIDDDEGPTTVSAPVPRELLLDPADDAQPGAGALAPPRPEAVTLDAEDDLLDDVPAEAEPLAEELTPALPEAAAPAPSIHAPATRRYEPEDDAAAASVGDVARMAEEAAAPRLRAWPDEKPAPDWLDDGARAAMRERAAWLEGEARATADPAARARLLLACSEIAATLGDGERGLSLAEEARAAAPSLALAHRQARALAPATAEPRAALAALDAEIRATPAGPAHVHSVLLAADALRASGDDAGAAARIDAIARLAAPDARAVIARAARALARGETAGPALKVAATPELAPIADAVATCLRLRGVAPAAAGGGAPSPGEVVLRARAALSAGDVARAASLVAELGEVAELQDGALWLAAALAAPRPDLRAQSEAWLRRLADAGDLEARRASVTRAFERGDRAAVAGELARPGPALAPEDRVALAALAGIAVSPADEHIEAAAASDEMRALACAAAALATPGDGADGAAQIRARAGRTAGPAAARALGALGRLLAAGAAPDEIEAALGPIGDDGPAAARAVALEMAARAGRTAEVSGAIAAWGAAREGADERAAGALAAALVAEWGGDRQGAAQASFKAARAVEPTCEAAVRAIASLEEVDLVAELNALADDLGDGVRGAFARIEAVALGDDDLPDPTKATLLEQAHRAAPAIPIAAFLAERIARRAGDLDEALRWVRERRAGEADAVALALDGVREALLIAEAEPALAEERLREAHEVRPDDAALRAMYERAAARPLDDGARWREQRALEADGLARVLAYIEAAGEHERRGDEEGALRCAEAAAEAGAPLGRAARERAELRTGRAARLSDELITQAKSAADPRLRREAFERLAALDATAGDDPASALLWHRSILEEEPGYKPSLRHVEQHLIGEGRDDELEPVLGAVAAALRSTGSAECSAHAEAAVRLRMRGAAGSWEATADVVATAAAEAEPALWSLRMRQAHARARGDDDAYLDATRRLVERAARPVERATLLVRAGEAAARLGRADEARDLLRRASAEDAGDVTTWRLLRDACRAAGDARGAAEACDELARSAAVEGHRLLALREAAEIWLDEAGDDDRGLLALQQAAAIDVTHADVFARLSSLYAARRMQPELADLLERRIARITDPAERLEIELRRGRVLFEIGDAEAARDVFEAALREHPDDVGALSAYADFCAARRQWETAEAILVQLARLLPTPDAQCGVYARLAELYSDHLVNLGRAEVSLKEVLKRSPDDAETADKLVRIYARQNDAARAVELQQELVARSATPEDKRRRIVELSSIHEEVARDNRRAEQVLEAGRREFPQDVGLLRALAELYIRHRQTPACNILLERASADARRGLAAGRLAAASFEIVAASFELRGRADAARAAHAMLDALEGRPAELRGAGAERALDRGLDDHVAPEAMTPALRALLARTGDVLDAATPVDLRALKAVAVAPDAPVARMVNRAAAAAGIAAVHVLSSPKLGATCVPVGSSPPALVLGEALVNDERLGAFLALRALKLVQVKASALGRAAPGELGVLVSAWLKCFSPSWQAQGINAGALSAAIARMQPAVPRSLPPDVGALALEIAGGIGTRQATLGPAAIAWANRTALIALGDPNAALDAIAAATAAGTSSPVRAAPRDPKDRAAWVARTPEARDLVAFGVADAFVEALKLAK